MILSIMLVALGFLIAMLVALLLAPAFWRRAERLTARRIEQSMPMSIAEAEAERDQIRASYAIIIRRLEAALSQEKMRSARQLVKISRLEMQIADLNDKTQKLRGQLDAEHNAASVLRRTIATRMPELNRAAQDARQLIHVRDREIDTVVNRLRHREEALAIAQRTTEMQQAEIGRLRQAMEMSGAQNAGRFKLRPTEWTIHDYRAEYDRLNVELSKLRERLAVAYDREANQVKELRTELQQLADQIVTTATSLPEGEAQRAIAHEPADAEEDGPKRASEPRTESVMRSIDAIIADTRTGARVPAVTEPDVHQRRASRSPLRRAATAPGRMARGALQKVAGLAGAKRDPGARRDSGGSRQSEVTPTPGDVSAARLLGGAAVSGGTPDIGPHDRPAPTSANETTAQNRSSEQASPGRVAPEATQTPADNRHTPSTVTETGPPPEQKAARTNHTDKQSESEQNAPEKQDTPGSDSEDTEDGGSLYDRYRAAKPASGKLMEDSAPGRTTDTNNQGASDPNKPASDTDIQAASTSNNAREGGGAVSSEKSASSGNGVAKPGAADGEEASDTDASPGSLLDRLKQVPESETR